MNGVGIYILEVDFLVENFDCYWPTFKSDIQNVADLLSLMIEDRYLPDQQLFLEILTDKQIASGELGGNSVKELLDFTDGDAYLL